ncbi:cyclase family protein [Aliiglaciecola sp. CAU 1673]|uniref:cyclase family protein n=1 Tax=Aliiglaciecola sp. CAU 1673 TaxID=3032595 RepID=UPI0023DA7C09|nr:cyclase family protein [Aliiglaciecola sp. CAU 1673]MDF2176813.1 cyclase family protein [Aliiglaciecola sp. CAU 1673]
MRVVVEIQGHLYQANMDCPLSVAIGLHFNGEQPNHFGVEQAISKPLEIEGFVGDTRRGGSCNVSELRFIPHCNGTHTESCGHILDEPVSVGAIAPEQLLAAVLVSVTPVMSAETNDEYLPTPVKNDRLITRAMLEEKLSDYPGEVLQAVLVRTLPNDRSKLTRRYGQDEEPAFFSMDALRYLNELGVQHLLTDLPSVDKMYDEGLLSNHHIFWQVAPGTHQLSEHTLRHKTITEMIFADEGIPDGSYLLNLQVPAFDSDAAPSRPILYPLVELEK